MYLALSFFILISSLSAWGSSESSGEREDSPRLLKRKAHPSTNEIEFAELLISLGGQRGNRASCESPQSDGSKENYGSLDPNLYHFEPIKKLNKRI
jgi:hypothetical protein